MANKKGNILIRYSNSYRGTNRKSTPSELKAALKFLEPGVTNENKPYKLQPLDLVDYKYYTNFKDAGMGVFIAYHQTADLLKELNVKK